MNRITAKFLDAQCARLNRITGNPETPWSTVDGRRVASIGTYYISGAYGGHSLVQLTNEGGAVTDIFRCGHIKARDLSERINAYITGIESVKA